MSSHNHNPSPSEEKESYIWVAIIKFIDGYDSGGGYFKLPLWILGITVTAIFAPYVILAGCLVGFSFFARALYDEHEKIKKEKVKIAEWNKLKNKTKEQENALVAQINDEWRLAYIEGETEGEDLSIINQRKDEPLKEANKRLLKILLNEYFDALTFFNVTSQPGKTLPLTKKIAPLIKSLTGFDPSHENFHQKMKAFLEDDTLHEQLINFFPKGEVTDEMASRPSGFFNNTFNKAAAFVKKQQRLRHFGNNSLNFLSNFGLGAGLAVSIMTLFGIIVIGGAPITWPLIAIIAVSGLAYGAICYRYQKVSGDRARRNTRFLDEEIKQLKIRSQLTNCLSKIYKLQDPLELAYKGGRDQSEFEESDSDANEAIERLQLPTRNLPRVKVPAAVYARMALGMLGQVILAISIATIISFGLIWIGTVLFPLLPLTVPTLGLGAFLSLSFLYQNVKKEYKSIKSELAMMQEVEEQKYSLLSKYQQKSKNIKSLSSTIQEPGNEATISNDLGKDNKVLLKELLQEYLEFVSINDGQKSKNEKGEYPKQEEIFNLIESIAGIKRPEENGEVLSAGNDRFYNELANYFKGNSKDHSETDKVVQDFKTLFVGNPDITGARVNAKDPNITKQKSWFEIGALGVNAIANPVLFLNATQRNLFAFLSIAAIGIMLPLFLFGAPLIAVAAVAAVVVGAYVGCTISSQKSGKNIESLENEKNKIELVDRKAKLVGFINSHNNNSTNKIEKVLNEGSSNIPPNPSENLGKNVGSAVSVVPTVGAMLGQEFKNACGQQVDGSGQLINEDNMQRVAVM